MKGIDIIVHFIHAFFGEKIQADRASSIHIYRYETKTWAGVWNNSYDSDFYFREVSYSMNEANLPRFRFKFFQKTFDFSSKNIQRIKCYSTKRDELAEK